MNPLNEGLSDNLAELCRRLARADDLRTGVEAVAWACDRRLPFYRVAVALPARRPDRLYVAAAWARKPEEELQGYDFVFRGHPVERAVREGTTIVRTDPSGDQPDPRLARLYEGEGKLEELVVPLDLGGRRGLLVFASRERGGFNRRGTRWAEEVAQVFALWVRAWAGPDAPHALKDQYETLLEGSLDGIAVLVQDRIAYANASFREIFGFSDTQQISHTFVDLLAPGSRAGFAEAMTLLSRQPRVLPRIEVEARCAGGAVLNLDVGVQPILYRGDPATLVQVHNATERAEREREALDSYARMDTLLHTLAHDIRGPLSTVTGFSELLTERFDGLAPEKAKEMLSVVSRSSRVLKDLVEGLLAYSSLSLAETPVRDVFVKSILVAVENELESVLRSTDARIEYHQIHQVVGGRPVELGRVFRNLVDNAVKYARQGVRPVVRISCAGEEDGFYVFCVEDNGEGIEPDRIATVFELFRRGERGGAGVGLAIVSRIVQAHGGRVWVESQPGQGSRFYVTLPKSSEEET